MVFGKLALQHLYPVRLEIGAWEVSYGGVGDGPLLEHHIYVFSQ